MSDMLDFCGMDIQNYDNTLIGWAGQNVQSGVTLGADNLEYCAGEAARNDLINNHNWTITGDTQSCAVTQPCTSTFINTYMGPATGTWHDAAHWDRGSIPDVCDEVVIPTGVTVTLDGAAHCYSLEVSVGGSFEADSHVLEVWVL